MKKITESDSLYDGLEKMSVKKLLASINAEDKTVAHSVEKTIPQIEKLVNIAVDKVSSGGRLFYVGATRTKDHLHIIRPKDNYKGYKI